MAKKVKFLIKKNFHQKFYAKKSINFYKILAKK